MIKPTADRISTWGSRTEILYRCGSCACPFTAMGSKIKFCFNCGTKVDWNVQRYIFKPLTIDDFEGQQKVIAEINSENKELEQ